YRCMPKGTQMVAIPPRGDSTDILVDGSVTHDLFVSLEAIAAPAMFPRWRTWAEQAAQSYTEPELRRLRRWFGGKIGLGRAYHALVPLLTESRDPAQLLRALGELPLGDFLRIAVTAGIVDPETPLESAGLLSLGRDRESARAFVERYLRVSGQLRTQVLRALADPEGARSELMAALRRQVELPAFSQLMEETQGERAQAAEALRTLAAGGVEAIQEQITRHMRVTEFAPVVLATSIFLDLTMGTYYQEVSRSLLDSQVYEPLILLVGTRRALGAAPEDKRHLPSRAGSADPIERAASLFSLLSDPSRLRLLELLAHRPHYGQELAAALGMSGATISHHVDLLLKAGVLKIERRAHRTYYVLQTERFAELAYGATTTLRGLLSRAAGTPGDTDGSERIGDA
ncbi:MAG: ArsR/SmtB family transcription factor, partial [Ktedonobacterales bacterium]